MTDPGNFTASQCCRCQPQSGTASPSVGSSPLRRHLRRRTVDTGLTCLPDTVYLVFTLVATVQYAMVVTRMHFRVFMDDVMVSHNG